MEPAPERGREPGGLWGSRQREQPVQSPQDRRVRGCSGNKKDARMASAEWAGGVLDDVRGPRAQGSAQGDGVQGLIGDCRAFGFTLSDM